MAEDRVIELTDAQLERAWQLTNSLVQNESSHRKPLDLLFITAARFVKRVDDGLAAGGVVLDTGKGAPGTLTFTVRRVPGGSR